MESLILHGYILSLLMDKIPPFDTNSICHLLPPIWERPKSNHIKPKKHGNLKNYEGIYGNRFFGNVTVTLDKKTNTLFLNYSKTHVFKLYETKTKDVFEMTYAKKGYGMLCLARYEERFPKVVFDRQAKGLDIPCFGNGRPNSAIFIRGLTQSVIDSYAPYEPIRSSCSVSKGPNIVSETFQIIFAFICSILFIRYGHLITYKKSLKKGLLSKKSITVRPEHFK